MFEVISSTTMNSAAVHSTRDQSGEAAKASASGKTAARIEPT